MDPRPIDQWTEILGKLPAPEGVVPEMIMARRILGDLVGYAHRKFTILRDSEELAHAMIAYARMMFDAGVRP
jgi:hypothetical protein